MDADLKQETLLKTIESLRAQLDLAEKMHDVAVKERDLARLQHSTLTARLIMVLSLWERETVRLENQGPKADLDELRMRIKSIRTVLDAR